MSRLLLNCLLFLVTEIDQSRSARILAVFPTASLSHQVVFRPLTQELARRGHEVTVITPNPVFNVKNRPANLTEIDVHDITYEVAKNNEIHFIASFGYREGIFSIMNALSRVFAAFTEAMIKSENVQMLIKTRSKDYFDLILIESCGKPYIMFSHLFKAPVILISSFGMMLGNDEVIGAPSHPFLYPSPMRTRVYNLTVWEKFYELYTHYRLPYNWHSTEHEEREKLKKYFGADLPTYRELYDNVDMMFLNMHPMLSNNQPLPANIVSIWGVYTEPEKDLPQDLQTYLDSSKNGVIYLSFGSNVLSSTLPSEKIKVLVNTFSKLRYDVLWKWETDELPGKSQNIRTSKWLPQADLLRHPNVKLFITQGGLQSTDQAIQAGVPLIGIPMFGDQWYNAEMYEHHRIGMKIEFGTLSEDTLRESIETVINDNSFKKNIMWLRSVMNDQSESALERAIWWTEINATVVQTNPRVAPLSVASLYKNQSDKQLKPFEIDILLLQRDVSTFLLLPSSSNFYEEKKTTVDEFEPVTTSIKETLSKNINCDDFQEYAVNCTVEAALIYNSSRMTPPIPSKINYWCRTIKHLINCAIEWKVECKDVSESHFNEDSIRGHIHVANNICDDELFQIRYVELSACIASSQDPWEECYKDFKRSVEEQKNTTQEWTHYEVHFSLCCARARFRRCTLESLFEKPTSCTHNEAVTLQKFSVIVSEGAVYQDCDHNMMYTNCPGGDPRPTHKLLRHLVNSDGTCLEKIDLLLAFAVFAFIICS
ncbi:unnamed protein product [Leptosia nina]|uniref:UDP-glycosyltransferase n=1 Tax=Leptosia nina TaxID=320188 RepID=A0AAV1JGI7_9NEOP